MLRIGATFDWTVQCENTLKLLKEELTKMPVLQYPNPNKPFQLFTDMSKHSSSGILHQEKEGQPNEGEPELIPITYFQVLSIKHSNFGTLCQMNVMQSIQWHKNSLFISEVQTAHYTVITNHKPVSS